jgi:Electron transfer DM13
MDIWSMHTKFILILLSTVMLVVSSCKKDEEPLFESPTITETDSLVSSSRFTSQGSYQVSGDLNIYLVDSMYIIEFADFRSSSGPALEVWLSEGISPTRQVSLGKLKSTSGNFFYTLSLSKNEFSRFTHVLIWCERFSVGFGYAPVVK